jgi:hypothetical protein
MRLSNYWRDEVAKHLALAAEELRTRRDGSFSRSFTVAMGYLEQAARNGISSNAERAWEKVRRAVNETESTAQMKLTPDVIQNLLLPKTGAPEQAPPSLPSNAPPAAAGEADEERDD